MPTIQVVRERHDAPEWAVREAILAGGLNRFGEPNYRVVWGWNRLTPVGGKWEDRDGEGANAPVIREVWEVRNVPRYPGKENRWHLERWCPPEAYGSPQRWYEQTLEAEGVNKMHVLGDYPWRGDYELCMTIESPDEQFVQITAQMVRYLILRIEAGRRYTSQERRDALYRREAKQERDYSNWAFEAMSDCNEWVYTPHAYMPKSLNKGVFE